MILDIVLIFVFAIIFNWAVNLQILYQVEKNKRDKTIELILALAAAIILGILSRG